MKIAVGTNFPISVYYKDSVVDAETLSNINGWWTAVLLLREPKGGNIFLALYKWQLVDGVWKKRMGWKFKNKSDFEKTLSVLGRFSIKLL